MLSSPVYVAFMDASKAFDKINHYHLMAKLINCEVPVIIVRLLYFWHCMQCFVVRWGGIASPIFFYVLLIVLINICENYAKRFELTFNVRKTK